MKTRCFFPLLAVVALGTLGACKPHVSDANLNQVKADMSGKEIESILGHPSRIVVVAEPEATEVVKRLTVTRYEYERDGKKVTLTLVGDKLAEGGIEGTFE